MPNKLSRIIMPGAFFLNRYAEVGKNHIPRPNLGESFDYNLASALDWPDVLTGSNVLILVSFDLLLSQIHVYGFRV